MKSDRLSIDPLILSIQRFSLPLVQAHCHLDAGNQLQDVLTLGYMRAAVLWAEGFTHRSICSRAHSWVLSEFPYEYGCMGIRLPRGKTQSVERIDYVANGITSTLTGPSASPAGTGFQQDLDGDDGGLIMPPWGGSWPGTDREIVPAPVTINFTAGYLSTEVPEDIIYALMFYVSDATEMKGSNDIDSAGRNAGPNLGIREQLLSPYMLYRW